MLVRQFAHGIHPVGQTQLVFAHDDQPIWTDARNAKWARDSAWTHAVTQIAAALARSPDVGTPGTTRPPLITDEHRRRVPALPRRTLRLRADQWLRWDWPGVDGAVIERPTDLGSLDRLLAARGRPGHRDLAGRPPDADLGRALDAWLWGDPAVRDAVFRAGFGTTHTQYPGATLDAARLRLQLEPSLAVLPWESLLLTDLADAGWTVEHWDGTEVGDVCFPNPGNVLVVGERDATAAAVDALRATLATGWGGAAEARVGGAVGPEQLEGALAERRPSTVVLLGPFEGDCVRFPRRVGFDRRPLAKVFPHPSLAPRLVVLAGE